MRRGLLLLPILLSAAVAAGADFSILRTSWASQPDRSASLGTDACSGNPDAAAQAVYGTSLSDLSRGDGYWTYSRWGSAPQATPEDALVLLSWHAESDSGLGRLRSQQFVSDLPAEALDGTPAYSWSCLGQSDAAELWPPTSASASGLENSLILAPTDVGDRVFKEAWVIRFEAQEPQPRRVEQLDDPESVRTE